VRQVLEAAEMKAADVRAVGVHGQTIRHRPELGFTRQTNNPALLAELTGIDVIADFRSARYCRRRPGRAAGAGLPPRAVRRQAGKDQVLANIGGIGNISVLHGTAA
jgi:anhydro-N-acetylmuramic acid kinase